MLNEAIKKYTINDELGINVFTNAISRKILITSKTFTDSDNAYTIRSISRVSEKRIMPS